MTTAADVDRPGANGPGELDSRDDPDRSKVRQSSWRLLGRRDFCLYFLGSLGSNLGTWLQSTVQVLLAYQLTHSVFYVGAVVSAQFAGTLFLSPWAAVLADRIGGVTTLVGTQVASALIAGAMAWRYHHHLLGVHSLIIGALGLGVAFALALPVQTALIPTLVDEADTQSAMAMNSVSYNSGRALAPALCVLVIALTGPDLIFALNSISFAIFAVVLCCLKPGARLDKSRPRPRAGVLDGFRTARRRRRLFLLLAIVAAVTLADDPIQVLSPGLAHALHVPTGWAAYFIAALGWGTVLCSLPPTARPKNPDPSHASRRAACSLLVLALSVMLFTAGISAPLSLFFAFVTGGAALFTGAATQTMIVGPHRESAASVAGLWAIAWAGTKPIASLLDGWLASHIGILLTGVLLAFPAAVLAIGELALSPEVKAEIKDWSLSAYRANMLPLLAGVAFCILGPTLRLLRLDYLRGDYRPEHEAVKQFYGEAGGVREPALLSSAEVLSGDPAHSGTLWGDVTLLGEVSREVLWPSGTPVRPSTTATSTTTRSGERRSD